MKTTLKILDQVNIKFDDLDPHTRRKMVEAVKFFLPHARHTPAYKLGRWDGTVSFANVSGASYLNLLDTLLPIVMDSGYEVDIEDSRPDYGFNFPTIDENFVSDRKWPKGHVAEGKPIMLRDYQVQAVNTYMKHQQCIQSISTGAGKTLMTAVMSLLCEPYGRTLVVVPSKSLVVQTEEDYVNMGLDCGVFFGERKELGRTHTICTWQSLASLMKKSKDAYDDEYTIADMIDGTVAVIVDEVHSAKGEVLKAMLTGPLANIPIRLGLTGTIPKEENDRMSILCGLGPVVGEIRASDLQEQGVLAQCHVNIIQLDDSHVEYSDYAAESDFLTSDSKRVAWMAQLCQSIATDGNTLILVNKIETGETMRDLIPDSTFVNGSTKNKDRVDQYKEVQSATNKVIIATYGVAAVGLNIPRIFNLVMIEPGKSFVRVIQSIGRGIRKAGDKDSVNIWDLTSNLKFSAKHLKTRKDFYKDANYPMTVTKADYRAGSTVTDTAAKALDKSTTKGGNKAQKK